MCGKRQILLSLTQFFVILLKPYTTMCWFLISLHKSDQVFDRRKVVIAFHLDPWDRSTTGEVFLQKNQQSKISLPFFRGAASQYLLLSVCLSACLPARLFQLAFYKDDILCASSTTLCRTGFGFNTASGH